MYLLAIESSCDETAAAVVTTEGRLCSNVVASQIEDHAVFGGVVPEIASRCHVQLVQPVVEQALSEAGITTADLGYVAVTRGPGLVGALLVGISFAKSLAYGLGIPLIGVNHLEGHLSAVQLEHEVRYPHIGMVVSGGHTSIYRVTAPGEISEIGRTLDDAAGEAFDKVAKLLDLSYPGGVIIDKISRGVDHADISLPRPMIGDDTYDFSFSGLKTAVLTHVVDEKLFVEEDLRFSGLPGQKTVVPGKEDRIPKIAAAFQAAVVDVITAKLMKAVRDFAMEDLVISGGVACNTALRASLKKACAEAGVRLLLPSPGYCTDNAAMIAMAALRHVHDGDFAGLDLNATSRMSPGRS